MSAQPGSPHIGLVVEGNGDKGAVPLLLRKRLYSLGEYSDIVGKPVPLHGVDKATREGGIEGYVSAAARPGARGVLVVVDCDARDPARLEEELSRRASTVTPIPVRVVAAVRDFEDWIYASAETLDLGLVFDEERGLTAIKRALLPHKYVKPTWQPRLADRMDLELASTRSESLFRLLGAVDELADLFRDGLRVAGEEPSSSD